MKKLTKLTSLILAATMITATSSVSFAFTKDGSDMDIITNTGVVLNVPQILEITQPAQSMTTSAASYTITGTSNPKLPLYLNGTEITNRGRFGSYSVDVPLSMGKNVITMSQGKGEKTVVITRSETVPYTVATKITGAFPTENQIAREGSEIKLKCTAPAGAEVYATFGGKKYQLKQNVAGASKGIAAHYSLTITVPQVSEKVQDLGNIKYTLVNNGNTSSVTSVGKLYGAAQNVNMMVQANQRATAVYEGDNTNTKIKTVLSLYSSDKVIDQNENMYKLSMGGWVSKALVNPLVGNYSNVNKVKTVDFEKENKGELYILDGNNLAPFNIVNTDESLKVTLFNTTGVTAVPTENSEIFSGADVAVENGNTIITFHKKNPKALWGYGVEYSDGGATKIYCRKPPVKTEGKYPLKGITIALDPGHGGDDPGALGTAKTTGPMEKDLTLATATAVKNRLEGLGATVIMSRTGDTRPNFNDRMETAMDNRADFFISVHYNSSYNTKATGYEIYYYNPNSYGFAKSVEQAMAANTGKNNRGSIKTPFRVVLNTYCPAILAEVEFISSPIGYDESCTKKNLYNVANAMAEGIINSLS